MKPAALALMFVALLTLADGARAGQKPPVISVKDGQLHYVADQAGNRVPDFSHAGYRGGGQVLPVIPGVWALHPQAGDNTARIQAALDELAARTPDALGHRGAVVLGRGRFVIEGQLLLRASGVVLRGQGPGPGGTVLMASGLSRRALIQVQGRPASPVVAAARAISDDYVPVNATRIRVADTSGLAPGMLLSIERPSPAEWLARLGMNDAPGRQPYQWQANTVNLRWTRGLVAIDGKTLVLDAPLTTALEKTLGGATVQPVSTPGYLNEVGIENLACESAYDSSNPLDEQHSWNAIEFDAVRDGWVSDVTGRHFAGSLVQLSENTARITVQDCAALQPVSELGGYRRMPFHVRGQQALFLRCRSEQARHDFSAGYQACGPNVFLECETSESQSFSGSIGAWASGLLFDNVSIDGAALRLDNLETWNQGVGWAAANSMLWQCSASVVICRTPPGAANWADGVWGQFVGDGRWSQVNETIKPDSLYRAQLGERLGRKALSALDPRKYSLPGDTLPAFVHTPVQAAADLRGGQSLHNGWLTEAKGGLLVGQQVNTAWWLGRLEPARTAGFGPAITRFSPGRKGTGATDDIPAMVAGFAAKGTVAFRHHWGLWYDRRRIDHQMIRRSDAEVSPPFFEMPWARSGQGRAWDGLSRYDLGKFNPWYFSRLKEFASEGRRQGVVLVNGMYFQHNIIESGAHWVEFPWRPVNNLQSTKFIEPPPFKGDTINVMAAFYDVGDPQKRELHRAYIRHNLEVLGDEPNVLHVLGDEYSGPLHFMQFWIDVAAEWERETGRHPLICLSGPKDVQDAILADPVRSSVIDVIDLKYWFRNDKGEEFAPAGGVEAAQRQHLRKFKGKPPSALAVAGMVAEYRQRFPQKAVIAQQEQSTAEGWSFVAAGGSFPVLPRSTEVRLLQAFSAMRPIAGGQGGPWVLGEPGSQYFVYAPRGGSVSLDLSQAPGRFQVYEVELGTGAVSDKAGAALEGGEVRSLSGEGEKPRAWWLVRRP